MPAMDHPPPRSDIWASPGPNPTLVASEPVEPTVHGTRVDRFHSTPWYLRAWVMLLVVTALAGGLRFWHLSSPHGYIFDEVYYAKDGCLDAGYPFKQCNLTTDGEQTVTVHPPIGRELIALSIRAFGDDEFGWRFGSAVAGMLSVLLLAFLAWKLLGSVVWGWAAGILLATESLNLVQSRVSMLDIYITVFVVAGFLFLVLDRRWIDRRTPMEAGRTGTELLLGFPPDPIPSPILRPWRLAAGVAFGAAMATKWSGGTALIGAILLSFAWERTRRVRWGYDHPIWRAFRDEAFGIFLLLVIVPVLIYLVSYTRWFTQHDWDFGAWGALQKQMATFSLGLRSPHPYASPAWKWILMIRPVAYYFQCPQKVGDNCITAQAIVGMGNPFVFWTSVFAVPYAAWAWVRRHDWRAGLVVVAVLVQYLPWFLARRTSFLFYMAPITPFLVLAIAYGLRDLSRVRLADGYRTLAPAAAGVVVVSVAVFAFFWPVLVGSVTSWGAWHLRMWFPSWV
jgi:dolichyl-phosphate-mannose-protein mannosyltransferase